jgi:hypothetical protein
VTSLVLHLSHGDELEDLRGAFVFGILLSETIGVHSLEIYDLGVDKAIGNIWRELNLNHIRHLTIGNCGWQFDPVQSMFMYTSAATLMPALETLTIEDAQFVEDRKFVPTRYSAQAINHLYKLVNGSARRQTILPILELRSCTGLPKLPEISAQFTRVGKVRITTKPVTL